MKQADLEKISGYRKSHLCRISKNHRAYTETRCDLEKALGIKPGDLLRNPNPLAGIDILEALKDPRAHVGKIPIGPDLKAAIRAMILGLLPVQQ